MTGPRSKKLHAKAQKYMPGGVNSPVRAFRSVGGGPLYFASGSGAYLTDVDGRKFVDYVLAWGPLILGHRPPSVVAALKNAIATGTGFGAPTALEVEMAEAIAKAVPGVARLRMVNSGTEATMATLRLARAATGRDVIVKFDGAYHGHSDSLLVAAGSGATTFGVPDSKGVPSSLAALTGVLPWNDHKALKAWFAKNGNKTAAVILEPVAGNMGVVPPEPFFLETVRELTTKHGALLIADEVMTGFRVAYRGAMARYGVKPDLVALGKVIGGGLPVGAYGGRADLMALIAPEGPVYQAGTMSGNPVALSAGLATLEVLKKENPYKALEENGIELETGLIWAAAAAGIPVRVNRVGSMLTVFFTDQPVSDLVTAKRSDTHRFARFFHGMQERGISLPPSQYESWFLSTRHDERVIEKTLAAARLVFKSL